MRCFFEPGNRVPEMYEWKSTCLDKRVRVPEWIPMPFMPGIPSICDISPAAHDADDAVI